MTSCRNFLITARDRFRVKQLASRGVAKKAEQML
jgi:hypothetical protein